jgi:hypothetical protein
LPTAEKLPRQAELLALSIGCWLNGAKVRRSTMTYRDATLGIAIGLEKVEPRQ